jgi:hypothetical protein
MANSDNTRDVLRNSDNNYNNMNNSMQHIAMEERLANLTSAGYNKDYNTSYFKDIHNSVEKNSNHINSNICTSTQGLKNDIYQSSLSNLLGQKDITHNIDISKYDISKEIACSKSDIMNQSCNQYAAIQLEQHRTTDALASQAAQNYASTLLEQHKIKEALSQQLFDAKYEALKNKDALSMQMSECCCEIKQKIDCKVSGLADNIKDIEANRIRDSLIIEKNENMFARLLNSQNNNRYCDKH